MIRDDSGPGGVGRGYCDVQVCNPFEVLVRCMRFKGGVELRMRVRRGPIVIKLSHRSQLCDGVIFVIVKLAHLRRC